MARMEVIRAKVDAPVDSETYPVNVLVQGNDIADSYCDSCLASADEWPTTDAGDRMGYYPGVMFNAALYCAACAPVCYDPHTGDRVFTMSGRRPS